MKRRLHSVLGAAPFTVLRPRGRPKSPPAGQRAQRTGPRSVAGHPAAVRESGPATCDHTGGTTPTAGHGLKRSLTDPGSQGRHGGGGGGGGEGGQKVQISRGKRKRRVMPGASRTAWGRQFTIPCQRCRKFPWQEKLSNRVGDGRRPPHNAPKYRILARARGTQKCAGRSS